MMTKSNTIAEIMTLNASVDAVFLAGFSNEDLLNYCNASVLFRRQAPAAARGATTTAVDTLHSPQRQSRPSERNDGRTPAT